MDPHKIRPSEVDYELAIRGVIGISSARQKALALKECLKREAMGSEICPVSSGYVFSVEEELGACTRILQNLIETIHAQEQGGAGFELDEIESRFIHLEGRLSRIEPQADDGIDKLNQLTNDLRGLMEYVDKQTAIRNASGAVRKSGPLDKRVSKSASDSTEFSVQPANNGQLPIASDFPTNVSSNEMQERNSHRKVHTPERFQFPTRADSLFGSNKKHPNTPGRPPSVLNPGAPTFRPSNIIDIIQEVRGLNRTERSSANDRHTSSITPVDRGTDNNNIRVASDQSNLNQRFSQLFLQRTCTVANTNVQIENRNGGPREDQVINMRRLGEENYNRFQIAPDRNVVAGDEQLDWQNAIRPNMLRQRQHFITDNNRGRPTAKTVPVNQWRVSYSGDGRGMHLFDFLSQLKLHQRSEMVSDDELLRAMTHLLQGRAAQWYESVYDSILTWDQLVEALKSEFLPRNYSFTLLNDIVNRRQKPNEHVGEYFTNMKSLFKWLGVTLTEEHKVHIVQKNLLPKFSSVALLGLRNLQELSDACRRIDEASAGVGQASYRLPFEVQQYGRQPPYRQNNVYAVEVEREEDGQDMTVQDEPEVCAIRRGANDGRTQTGRPAARCFNCNNEGHVFRFCREARQGVFCYMCGTRNVTSRNCDRCLNAGNEVRGSASQISQPDPRANVSQANDAQRRPQQ